MPNPYQCLVTKCAICGRTKGETNHWFTVEPGQVAYYVVLPYTDKHVARSPNLFPVCGSECRARMEQRIIDNRSKANEAASKEAKA